MRKVISVVIIALFIALSVFAQGKQVMSEKTSKDLSGEIIWSWSVNDPDNLDFPTAIEVGNNGHIYILFSYTNKLLEVDDSGLTVNSYSIDKDYASVGYNLLKRNDYLFVDPIEGENRESCIVIDTITGEITKRKNVGDVLEFSKRKEFEKGKTKEKKKLTILKNVNKNDKVSLYANNDQVNMIIDYNVVDPKVRSVFYVNTDVNGNYYLLLRATDETVEYLGPRGDARKGNKYWMLILYPNGSFKKWFRLKTAVLYPVLTFSNEGDIFQLWADYSAYYLTKWKIQ